MPAPARLAAAAALVLLALPATAPRADAGPPDTAGRVAPGAPEGERSARGDAGAADAAESPNGFALEDLRVPRSDVRAGGPPRDGVRSVDEPRFVPVAEARWVRADTPVIGVSHGGEARAYPVHVMEWHQVVNDSFGDERVAITYDPLTDLAGAWRWPDDGDDTFGVSGLLDRDGFLLYDRATESLWSSATGRAISGVRAGSRLEPLGVRVETMAAWLERHPDTRVLVLPERRRIDYRQSPYSAYWVSKAVPLDVRARDERFHPKEVVLGVEYAGRTRAYIGSILTRAGGRIVDEIAGERVRILYDGPSGTFVYEAPEQARVRSAYWFAWKSLHPETEIWGEHLAGDVPADPASGGDRSGGAGHEAGGESTVDPAAR